MLGQGTTFLNTFEQALRAELSDPDNSTEETSDLLDNYADYFLQHFCGHMKTQNDMLLWLLDGREISKDLQTAKNHVLATLLGNPITPKACVTKLVQTLYKNVTGKDLGKEEAEKNLQTTGLLKLASSDTFTISSKTLYSLLFSLYSSLSEAQDAASLSTRRSSSKEESRIEPQALILSSLKKSFPEFTLSNAEQKHLVLSNIDANTINEVAQSNLAKSIYGKQSTFDPSDLKIALRLAMQDAQPFQGSRPNSAISFVEQVRRLNSLTSSKQDLNKPTETDFFSVAPPKKPSKSSTDAEKAWLALWQHAHTLWQEKNETSQAKATTMMDCMLNIPYERPTLCQHREQWKPIVANIALCLIGGFVLYGLGLLLRYAWQRNSPKKNTTQQHTLPFWETQSEKRLKAVQTATATATAA